MERLANVLSRDGRIEPSTSNQKDFGVITLLVIAEREWLHSLRTRRPLSCQRLLEVSAFLYQFLI